MHNPKRHRKRELPSPCNNLAEKKSACSVSKLFCYSFEVENLDQGPSSNGLRLFLSFLGQTLVSPFSFPISLWPDLTFLTGVFHLFSRLQNVSLVIFGVQIHNFVTPNFEDTIFVSFYNFCFIIKVKLKFISYKWTQEIISAAYRIS